jgi:starch phosphorylase
LIEFWNDTNQTFHECDPKRVYYMSIEFLMGRALQNAVVNLDITGPYAVALKTLGYKLEEVIHEEQDAALGNGGLGRLAACFLDSLATVSGLRVTCFRSNSGSSVRSF